jgi:hypothetical protein
LFLEFVEKRSVPILQLFGETHAADLKCRVKITGLERVGACEVDLGVDASVLLLHVLQMLCKVVIVIWLEESRVLAFISALLEEVDRRRGVVLKLVLREHRQIASLSVGPLAAIITVERNVHDLLLFRFGIMVHVLIY